MRFGFIVVHVVVVNLTTDDNDDLEFKDQSDLLK